MAASFEPLTSRSNTWQIRPQDDVVLLKELLSLMGVGSKFGLASSLTELAHQNLLNKDWSILELVTKIYESYVKAVHVLLLSHGGPIRGLL